MTAVSIMPEKLGTNGTTYRAIAGAAQSIGRTPGEALDALNSQLGNQASGTLVVVQQLHPDRFFTAQQQERLEMLMTRWREARDAHTALPPEEQTELDSLVEAELQGASQRAAALVRELAR